MVYTSAPFDRVFIEIGPLTIYWYGVIIATGAAIGLWLAMKEAERLGWNKDLLIDFLIYAVPIAIIFARIYYVTFEWERYSDGPLWKVIAIWEGGIAIHGAVIGGVVTAIVFSRVSENSLLAIGRYRCSELNSRTGYRPLGKLYEPRGTWRPNSGRFGFI